MLKSRRFDKSMLKCFICENTVHFKKDCTKREKDSTQVAIASDEDKYDSAGALVVSSLETTKS